MKHGKFDFDEWAALFKGNPAEFERKRIELLSSAIDSMESVSAKEKSRLKELVLTPAKPDDEPLKRAVDAFNAMNDSMQELLKHQATAVKLMAARQIEAPSAIAQFTRLEVRPGATPGRSTT